MRTALLLLLGLIAMLDTSCSYARARWDDAKDVFTAGVGLGIGGVAHVGPLQAGLGATVDYAALANGEVGTGWIGICGPSNTTPILASGIIYGINADGAGEQRGKAHAVAHALVPMHGEPWPSAAYYTQIEVSGGALLAVHVGFNPGELVDLLLGFVGIDIYGDDRPRDPSGARRRSASPPVAPPVRPQEPEMAP